MATSTTKLQLRKPVDADDVDVTLDLSDNMDKLDAAIDRTVANAAARNALTAYDGMMCFQSDTEEIYVYDGAAWQQVADLGAWTAYVPTVTNFPGVTITRARYKQIGKTVFVEITLTATGAATGEIEVDLPVAISAADLAAQTMLGVGFARDTSANTTTAAFMPFPTTATTFKSSSGGGNVSNGGPIGGIGAGDWFKWNLVYEAA